MSETEVNQNKKRKRKKSFLKNARKYAKKGCYGRGSELDSDTYQYFVRILEAYRAGFDTEDDKLIFANNVFEQTENNEINCCCNQVGCRVVEMLLPFANDTILIRYMEILGEDLRKLCNDRFASHVLETLFKVACKKSLLNDSQIKYKEFTLKLSKFLLNNLEDYMWDIYANHIIRTVVQHLPQMQEETKTTETNDNKINNELLEEYESIVTDYAERLLAWPQFKDLPYSEITSGFLQILLKVLHKINIKLLKKYLKKLIDESFSPQSNENATELQQKHNLSDVFMSKPAIMVLETSMQVATPKRYTQIYAKCFLNKLPILATTRSTNFSVQKLLTSCNEKTEFEAMFEELNDHFKSILDAGHTGILLALAETCKKLSAKQGAYVQNLMKCFDCFNPEERQNGFVLCMSKLISYDEMKKQNTATLEKDKLNLHGTLILQAMLEFHKPIKIINSILSLNSEDIKNLFSNSMGSHIADSYMKSVYVGEKSREKLIKKLKGTYQDLAKSKYGSRTFDAIWGVSTFKNRLLIMDELSYKEAAWSNTEFGKIISNKINLTLYKRNKEEWKTSFDKNEKKKLLFADIIN